MKNVSALGMFSASAATAGPGQIPASPHPIPNSIEPTIKRRSRVDCFGKLNSVAHMGFEHLRIKRKQIPETVSAPNITKIKLGSH